VVDEATAGLVQPVVAQLRGIRKVYAIGTPAQTEVLHGIDLTIRRGEFCAVMGPSGCGKSTLLNLMGLLDRPTSGSIEICSKETTTLPDAEITALRGHRIGFVFQYHCLMSAFTAAENVMMPLLGAAHFPNRSMAERASELLRSVGLAAFEHQRVGNLSGGQQQRVALARGLAMNPALLLADEPTGNLDSQSASEVFELLRRVNRAQGTAIVFVTHNAALAQRCDRIIRVLDGRIEVPAGAVPNGLPDSS
jgi:lipoprotein-releasing system ATP-binding protein